jgi:biopolymer transport protein TolR
MGMSTGATPTREINMTPLIDVLLVLLVIFLVAMPIMMRMQQVALPPSVPDAQPAEPAIVLHLEADLTITIEDGPRIARGDLARELRRRARPEQAVFVDFDDALPWSEVVSLLDSVKATLDDARLALRMRRIAQID